MSIPGGLAVGMTVGLIVTVLLSSLVAKLLQTGVLAQNQTGYAVMGLLLAASFAGAAVAQGRVKHRRRMICMLSGGIYYLSLLAITALFFGGQYTAMGVTALVVLAGCGTAALMCVRQGRRGKAMHRKRHGNRRLTRMGK